MKCSSTILLFVIGLQLTGCASVSDNPIVKSNLRNFETQDIDEKDEIYRAGYVGRFLLEPDAQRELIQRVGQMRVDVEKAGGISELSNTLNRASTLSTTGMIAGDMVTGALGSGTGNSIGNAMAIGAIAYGLFSSDGSEDLVSGVYLPSVFNGTELTSAKLAQKEAYNYSTSKLTDSLEMLGYEGECIEGCDDTSSVFEFKKLKPSQSEFLDFAPPRVLVLIAVHDLVSTEQDLPYHSRAVQFPVKWHSKYVNGFQLAFITDDFEEKYEANAFKDEEGKVRIRGEIRFDDTMFAEFARRGIFNNPFLFQGTSDSHPKWLAYNGNFYRFVLNSRADTFDEILLPSIKLTE